MAQTIKLKRSSTAGSVPSTSSLSLGEVAINTYDGKMYIKKDDGSESVIEVGVNSTIAATTLTGNLSMGDNIRARFGDSNDLQIYHDGATNSVIADTGSGFLSLQSNGTEIALYDTANNANMGRFITGGSVNLFYNGNTKFQTTNTGINVTGTVQATALSAAATYTSIIYGGASALQLKSNTGEMFAEFNNNGNAELYYDNSKKFETTSTGIDVTGAITTDGLTSAGTILATSSTTINTILRGGDGNSKNLVFQKTTGSAQQAKISAVGDDLRFTTGPTDERMRITSSGDIGIGTTAPTSKLDIRSPNGVTHSRGQLYLTNTDTAAINNGSQISLGGTYSGTSDTYFASIAGRKENATVADYAGYLQFATRASGGSNTERMRIDSSGRVGIGTSSSATQLTVALPSGTNGDIINMARWGGAYSFNLGLDENSTWYLSNASDEKLLNVTYTGKVGIGTSAPAAQLHVKSAGNGEIEVERTSGALINLQAQSAAGYIGTDSNHLFGLKANGTVRLKIATGGAISFNDAFTFPTADGSTNQVLKTDGSGNMSWVSVAVGTPTYLADADGDTKIQVEESADEDIIRFDAAGVERFKIGSDVQVMGTTDFNITGSNRRISFTSGTGTVRTSGAYSLNFGTSNTDHMTITSAGNVGIGTTAPYYKLDTRFSNATTALSGGDSGNWGSNGIRIDNTNTTVGAMALAHFRVGDADWHIGNKRVGTDQADFIFANEGATKMLIDHTGNVGIGTTAPDKKLEVAGDIKLANSGKLYLWADHDLNYLNYSTWRSSVTAGMSIMQTAASHLALGTSNTERMRIDSSGNVGIGTTAVGGTTTNRQITSVGSATSQLTLTGGGSYSTNVGTNGTVGYLEVTGANNLALYTNSTERMRIDASGNLLVGKTTSDLGVTAGIELNGQYDVGYFTRSAEKALVVNRLSTDGTIAEFRKDGTTVGRIGTDSGDLTIYGTVAGHMGFRFGNGEVYPTNNGGSLSDNTMSLGSNSIRFKNLYLSGGLRGDTLTFSNLAGTERMRIDASGKVGIGTSSPDAGLDLGSSAKSTWTSGNYYLPSGNAYIRAKGTNAEHNWIGITGGYEQSSGSANLILQSNFRLVNEQAGNYISSEVQSASSAHITFGKLIAGSGAGTNATKSEFMRIDSSGNVGIGTSNPTNHINTGSFFKPDSSGKFLTMNGGANGSFIMLESSTTTDNDQIGGIYWNRTGAQGDAHKQVAGIDVIQDAYGPNNILEGGTLRFFTKQAGSGTNTPRMTILGGGNVGIGTTSPNEALEVKGSIRIDNGASFTAYQVYRDNILYGSVGGGSNQFTIQASNNKNINLFDDSGAGLTVKDGGNVGIGTTNPATKLDVAGIVKVAESSNTAFYAGNYVRVFGAGQEYGFRNTGGTTKANISMSGNSYFNGGNVGIGTATPQAKLQVNHAGIDTYAVNTTAITLAQIDTFAAATFRSARYTIQATNSTDSTYHITEVLLIHDGTNAYITEYGTMFTGSSEGTISADIAAGNVRLLVTPASTDTIAWKVVRHSILV